MDFSTWSRPACIAQLGGFRPPEDPTASWIGRVLVALPGETWPTTEGAPMLPLAQINLGALPCSLPRALADLAMVTMFLGPWELPVDEPNGRNWELRAYDSLEALVPLAEPTPARAGNPRSRKGEDLTLRPFPIRWEQRSDFPCRDCVPAELADQWDAWADDRDPTELTFDGTKVGGWPYCLQGEVRWSGGEGSIGDGDFVLQIGTEEKAGLSWGYGGIGYVARQPGREAEEWHLTWQSL